MMNTISVETLRTWLEEHHDVLVLDVRSSSDYQEWTIPGSLHVDAYEALKRHDPEALAALHLDASRPVVTVCGVGKTSQIAAAQLAARGVPVSSLEGGMKAWSLAWNTAEMTMPGSEVQVIQVRRTGKGCLSYLVGVEKEACVIDASLDPQIYLDLASHHGWHITKVFETHIHADHLSRSRLLAGKTDAMLFLPAQQRVSFPSMQVHDGDAWQVGPLSLTALHTPGHTPESTCYLLGSHMLFTGDTLFTASVGRPDLHTTQEDANIRAEALYHSLHTLLTLPAETIALPGHSSHPIPFDGVPISTTLAHVEEQIKLLHLSRADFVRHLLRRLPAKPPNYDRIVTLNEAGLIPDQDVTDLEAGANRCAVS
jgi:glyoxylase-like metal-dependent hydrolase (beta-lactamase superfamily II)/rhodanese-related sulfurtransferase